LPNSVYVETSVVSACVTSRDDPVSQAQRFHTTEWWISHRPFYEVFYSQAVAAELHKFSFPGQEEALALLEEMQLLPITPEVDGVAHVYQNHLVMPKESMGDAVHLALACVHEVDYLLTWNCKHLANASKIEHIQVVNRRLGLLTPVILTPEMLLGRDDSP